MWVISVKPRIQSPRALTPPDSRWIYTHEEECCLVQEGRIPLSRKTGKKGQYSWVPGSGSQTQRASSSPAPSGPLPTGGSSYQPPVRPAVSNTCAIVSLYVGAIGLIPGTFLLSLLALILGLIGKSQIEKSEGKQLGRDKAIIGIVLGVAGLALGFAEALFAAAGHHV
jgi:hypothetical protein